MTSTTFKPKLNLSPGAQARVALMRFGLGPKPGVAARLSTEDGAAFQACLNEIYNPATLLIPDDQVKTYCTDTQADVVLDYATCCRFGANWPWKPPSTGFLPQPLNIITAETAARFAKGLEPDVGFAERLVHFWSNHFSIHGSKTVMVRSVVGHFERSVIRPGVLGKFSDLLKAVYQHPAMICNLENERSIGLNSPYGKDPRNKTRVVDINENLAREIFELHTLGIDGGHRQADVVNFAKVLSGWTIYGGGHPKAGQFYFEPAFHEPGAQTVLGVTYGQTGIDQGLAVLDALARHPSTAQHIAYKLIRHFITDEPPPALVAYLARLFRFTGGDLQVMAKALICLPQFWAEPMVRISQPLPWQMAITRGSGLTKETMLKRATVADQKAGRDYPTAGSLSYMTCYDGQTVWGCLTPDGYPDDNYFWMNANSVRMRKDTAAQLVGLVLVNSKLPRSPDLLAADLLSGFPESSTIPTLANMVKAKVSDRHCLAILFSSPEYLLR